MVRLEPKEPKWKTELGYAYNNLGTLLYQTGRPKEAVPVFQSALKLKQQALGAAPKDRDRLRAVGQSYAWLGDSTEQAGDISAALDARTSERKLYQSLLATDPRDAAALQSLLANRNATSRLLLSRGLVDPALAEARQSVSTAEQLSQLDPTNALRASLLVHSRLQLADVLIAGALPGADDQIAMAIASSSRLAEHDPKNGQVARVLWEAELTQAEQLTGTQPERALSLIASRRPLLEAAHAKDPSSRILSWLLARSWLVECQASSDRGAGLNACGKVVEVLASLAPTDPQANGLRLAALSEAHDPLAEAVKRQLNQLGFRHPKYLRLLS